MRTLLSAFILSCVVIPNALGQSITIGDDGIVRCKGVQIGTKQTIFGDEYEVVDRDLLILRRDQGGDLTKVCVSNVTDMRNMFYGSSFNQPIGNWDVSNVTDMNSMFYNSSFNQPIGNWDVSNVTVMRNMFFRSQFNQPIGTWNVSSVVDMRYMFTFAPFNQAIGNWNVSNVTNMFRMFEWSQFNQPIGNWDVSSVTDMLAMFSTSPFNQPIGNWDVSSVTNMSEMFAFTQFNQPIGNWDVSNVMYMSEMFYYSQFNQDISRWCVLWVGSEPESFSTSYPTITPLSEDYKPVWGTCPVSEFNISGDSGFRLMSTARNGANLLDFIDPLWTQGMIGADTRTGAANVWKLTNGSGEESGWSAFTDLSNETVAAGQGFLTYVFADTDHDGVDDLPVTLSFTTSGTANRGDITTPTISANEWYLAGNPYPLTLDWDLFTKTNLSGAVYVYDPALPGWRTWNGSTGTLTNGLIPPYQGFFVRGSTSSSGSLTMSLSDTVNTSASFYKPVGDQSESGHNPILGNQETGLLIQSGGTFSIKIEGSSRLDESLTDWAFLSFTREGRVDADDKDALKLRPLSQKESVVLLIEGVEEALEIANLPLESIDSHGLPIESISLPLQVLHIHSGLSSQTSSQPHEKSVTLSWDANDLPSHISIKLNDKRSGKVHSLAGDDKLHLTIPSISDQEDAFGGNTFSYPIKGDNYYDLVIEYSPNFTSVNERDEVGKLFPTEYALHQNHPNPFNPTTTISYSLPKSGMVQLDVYDVSGRFITRLVDGVMGIGTHSVEFKGDTQSSGLYIYILRSEEYVEVRKMMLVK